MVKIEWMLDSGAFSAWSKGETVSLNDYIGFILKWRRYLHHYVNLDVIPGQVGRVPTVAEVEESASKGWQNMLQMEQRGLEPIPVFHMGEKFKWLEKMIQHGCDYVGISPANDRTTQAKQQWLDRVFTFIGDESGVPRIKTHAFGMTSVSLLHRYPWYSADSLSWIRGAAYGNILVPETTNTGWDFTRSPRSLTVSRSNKSNDYLVGSESIRKAIREFVEFCGESMNGVMDNDGKRAKVNAICMGKIAEAHNTTFFRPASSGFFKDL